MANNKLTAQDRIEILNLAATSKLSNMEIAKQFNVTPTRVGQIVKASKPVVDRAIDDAVYEAVQNATGKQIMHKEWRMREYERDLLKLDGQYTSDAVNARTRLLGQVAKELGDIAPSQHQYTAEVSHRIIGIDFESPAEVNHMKDALALTGSGFEEISGIVEAEIIDD